MNFAPDDFASVHRRKRLAAWLGTLKGPGKPVRTTFEGLAWTNNPDALRISAALQNARNPYAGALGSVGAHLMDLNLWRVP